MIKKNIKLHLGCGMKYLPDYINIDLFTDTVADMICDISYLPIKRNYIAEILIEHLIEHFDLITSKYIISQFFLIIKDNGRLILETPDLNKSAKLYTSSDLKTRGHSLIVRGLMFAPILAFMYFVPWI